MPINKVVPTLFFLYKQRYVIFSSHTSNKLTIYFYQYYTPDVGSCKQTSVQIPLYIKATYVLKNQAGTFQSPPKTIDMRYLSVYKKGKIRH